MAEMSSQGTALILINTWENINGAVDCDSHCESFHILSAHWQTATNLAVGCYHLHSPLLLRYDSARRYSFYSLVAGRKLSGLGTAVRVYTVIAHVQVYMSQ